MKVVTQIVDCLYARPPSAVYVFLFPFLFLVLGKAVYVSPVPDASFCSLLGKELRSEEWDVGLHTRC